MSILRTSLVQPDLHWQSADANLAMLEEMIWSIEGGADLIVLPEMFNTGFTMAAAEYAEPMNSRSYRWMKQMAAQTGAVVTGSIIVKEKGNFFNRLLWMAPDGHCLQYDKRHLFRMGREHLTYNAGQQRLIAQLNHWRICPLVCYDLRFPVWSRNQYHHQEDSLDYDVLIYVANWPMVRVKVWDTLLQARALENQCYVLGVNRIGTDGEDIAYNGHTNAINYKGEPMLPTEERAGVRSVEIDLKALQDFRQKFPAYKDGDRFSLER